MSPRTSVVRELYNQYACPLVRVVQGLSISWDPVLATSYCKGFWTSATWSPCSRFIAVSKVSTISILDAATLEPLNTFKSPRDSTLTRLGFSPDGRTLTKLHDSKFTSWDLQTGIPMGTVSLAEAQKWGMYYDPFLFAHSMDGKALAVSNPSSPDPTLIDTYDISSGTHTCSYRAPEGCIISPLWTHGECLRFVTVKPGSITIWEATFTSTQTPAMVESFPTPDEMFIPECKNLQFLPTLSQLTFTVHPTVFVWDARDSRFLLKSEPISTPFPPGSHRVSFSSDGHFFLYTATSREIHVCKRSPTGYVLHQKFTFPWMMEPLLSPNGESIIASGRPTLHLWHTRDRVLSLPGGPVRESQGNFTLEFSPDKSVTATARFGGKTITILDAQSGNLRLTIDTGLWIRCLKVTGSTVVVVSEGKIMTWRIPTGDCADAKASADDSVHTTTFDCSNRNPQSISPDLHRIAITGYEDSSGTVHIHDVSTGRRLAGTSIPDGPKRVTLSQQGEVWCINWANSGKGWSIIEDSESGIVELKSLETTTCPPQLLSWQSSCGYEVTDDGWVLSPTKKRLLWLPHHWRSDEMSRTWNGRFLGLVHGELLEAVILAFPE